MLEFDGLIRVVKFAMSLAPKIDSSDTGQPTIVHIVSQHYLQQRPISAWSVLQVMDLSFS